MLTDFIEYTRSEPFEWGRNDCALWCASAVRFDTGFDPAHDLRGTYSTRFECRKIVMRAGGLLALVAPRMAGHGITELCEDGVAVMKIDGQQLCGLVLDDRAVVKMQTGLRVTDDFTIIRGWSWPQR